MKTDFYLKAHKIDKMLSGDYNKSTEKELLLMIESEQECIEYTMKKIFDIRWFDILKEKDYFLPINAPGPVESSQKGYFIFPEWNVLPYLEKVSLQIKENPEKNKAFIKELLDIIKDVTKYHIENDKKLDNYRTWWYFVKILCNLPKKEITEKELDLIPVWLDSKIANTLQGSEIVDKLLPKFLENPEDIDKAEKIARYLLAFKEVEIKEGKKELRTIIESFYLEEAFLDRKYASKLGENCSVKLINDIETNIKKFLKSDKDGTYLSFYSKTKYYESEPLELLAEILRQILVAKSKISEKETRSILELYLKDEFYYFKKMALYVIGNNEANTAKYKDIYFEELEKDEKYVLLDGFSFGDELKQLFNKFKELTPEQIKLLETKIDTGPEIDYKSDKDIWKQKRYKALSNIKVFKDKYEKIKNEKNHIDTDLSAAIGEIKFELEQAISPIKVEELLQKSNKEIAKYLHGFKPYSMPFPERDFDGLCGVIVDAVKIQPEKFINDLDYFKETAFIYVRSILSGIRNVWNDKKTVDWPKVFGFIKEYIDRKEYWNDDEKYTVKDEWKTNHIGLVGIISEIIREGSQEDIWIEEYFKPIEEIMSLLITGMLKEKDKILEKYRDLNDDPVTHAMNTPFGKLSEALFLFTLRIKRFEVDSKKVQEVNWENILRNKYEDLLNNSIPEGHTWLGRYLINFNYLDKDWTIENIKLEKFKGDSLWECFIIGYLSSGIYKSLYDSIQPHYERALEYKFKKDDTTNRLIRHICVGYLVEKEDFTEKTLFGKMLKKWDVKQIHEIISCFWIRRKDDIKPQEEKEQKRIDNKILEFWGWVYERYKKNSDLTDGDKKILAELAKLTVFLPEINEENSKWLSLSAPNAEMGFDSMYFIEYLNDLKGKGKSINYIGDIYLKMLETSTPNYKKEHIIEIVDYLYEIGKKEKVDKYTKQANEICNIYGSRGLEFLRGIWEKNN